MVYRVLAALAALSLTSAIPQAATAQPAQGPYRDRLDRDPAFRLFIRDLQRAISTGNREAVLRMIRYPLRVNGSNTSGTRFTHRSYRNAAAVRASFGRIFDQAVRRDILAQRYDMLWGNWQGYMIGNGTLWFDRICLTRSCRPEGPVRIVAINVVEAQARR